jgi:hypothetical protein
MDMDLRRMIVQRIEEMKRERYKVMFVVSQDYVYPS